jgi:heme-degrading monooxygenase HmoA
MFIVLYRWKLKPGHEAAFVAAWSRVTSLLKKDRHSLGARLHEGNDGLWYSYAQWPSAEAREAAFAQGSVDPVASQLMQDAIAEKLEEIQLTEKGSYL